MKKSLFIVCVLMPLFASSQRLVKNEYDKFQKWHVKETSWVTLATRWAKAITCKGRNVDGKILLDFKVGINDAFDLKEGSTAMLLLNNDMIIELPCSVGEVSYNKNGQWMAEGLYLITKEQQEIVTSSTVKSLRV